MMKQKYFFLVFSKKLFFNKRIQKANKLSAIEGKLKISQKIDQKCFSEFRLIEMRKTITRPFWMPQFVSKLSLMTSDKVSVHTSQCYLIASLIVAGCCYWVDNTSKKLWLLRSFIVLWFDFYFGYSLFMYKISVDCVILRVCAHKILCISERDDGMIPLIKKRFRIAYTQSFFPSNFFRRCVMFYVSLSRAGTWHTHIYSKHKRKISILIRFFLLYRLSWCVITASSQQHHILLYLLYILYIYIYTFFPLIFRVVSYCCLISLFYRMDHCWLYASRSYVFIILFRFSFLFLAFVLLKNKKKSVFVPSLLWALSSSAAYLYLVLSLVTCSSPEE